MTNHSEIKTTIINVDNLHNTIEIDGIANKVEPIVLMLLVYFIRKPNVLISREELAQNVWNANHVSNDAINRSIYMVRKSLSANRDEFLTTIHKKGYRFQVPKYVEFVILNDEHGNASCNGLIAPDTLIRDNKLKLLRCHYESEKSI